MRALFADKNLLIFLTSSQASVTSSFDSQSPPYCVCVCVYKPVIWQPLQNYHNHNNICFCLGFIWVSCNCPQCGTWFMILKKRKNRSLCIVSFFFFVKFVTLSLWKMWILLSFLLVRFEEIKILQLFIYFVYNFS